MIAVTSLRAIAEALEAHGRPANLLRATDHPVTAIAGRAKGGAP